MCCDVELNSSILSELNIAGGEPFLYLCYCLYQGAVWPTHYRTVERRQIGAAFVTCVVFNIPCVTCYLPRYISAAVTFTADLNSATTTPHVLLQQFYSCWSYIYSCWSYILQLQQLYIYSCYNNSTAADHTFTTSTVRSITRWNLNIGNRETGNMYYMYSVQYV